jgi:hypothetical protein
VIVPDLDLVARRTVVEGPIDVRFPLRAGDRPLVAAGDTLVPGSRIIDRVRDARLVEVRGDVGEDARPGDRWSPQAGSGLPLRRGSDKPLGELLFELGGQWRMAAGEHVEPVDAPIAGVVHEVRPGVGIGVRAEGRVIRGVEALGDPTRGVLALGAESGEGASGPGIVLRPGSLDIGLAGTILVIGSRVDAEALTRSRAMGLRGVIVAGLAGKERRDFLSSEARQRASLHKLPTFAVLVLDGAMRRRIASPISDVFAALAGREVAIVTDPPALVFDEPSIKLPVPRPDLVRVRAGERAGREGRWAGLAGLRRFADGAFLESGWVQFDGAGTMAIPLADLERFG